MKSLFIVLFLMFGQINLFCQQSLLEVKEENHETSFSTINWLKDDLTIPIVSTNVDKGEIRNYFSGIRIVFEPQISYLFTENENRVDNTSLTKVPKIGLETNLYKSWISLQGVLIYPSSVTFDDNSEIIKLQLLKNNNKELSLDYGYAIGLSIADGLISFGYMVLNYDTRDFISKSAVLESSGMLYINFQPIATAKSLIRRLK